MKNLLTRFALLLIAVSGVTQAPAAIPEPPVIFYGSIARAGSGTPLTPAAVAWTISGYGESVAVATSFVTVNGTTFYVARLPFETRTLSNGSVLKPGADTLGLSLANTAYTRSARVDGRPAILPANQRTFTYGASAQGLAERIDLQVDTSIESFAEWSQRLLGRVVDQTADEDGDGRSNYDEFIAGTNPQNVNSDLIVVSFTPAPSGGYTITWTSVAEKTYRVERSTDLAPNSWVTLQASVPGTGNPISYTDAAPSTSQRVFYRVLVNEL